MVQIENLPLIFTGLSITASIVYYASVLRNANTTQQHQLETRQAQLFMQIFNHYVSSEFRGALNEIEKWDWTTFEDFWENYGDPIRYPDNYTAFSKVGMFYEGLGTLVSQGLIDVGMISEFFGGLFIDWYDKWTTVYDGIRAMYNQDENHAPRSWKTSYLYEQIKKYRDENPDKFN